MPRKQRPERTDQPEMPDQPAAPSAPEKTAAEETAPDQGDQAEAGADAESRTADLGSDAEPRIDPRELSIEEAARRLREQMADHAWRERERLLVLRLAVAEDPTADDYLQRAFGSLRHPERTLRAWRRAQALVDASPDGRALGGRVELVPGGGSWHAWLHSPVLGGGFPAVKGDFRAPSGALRRVARAYLAAVVEDGTRALEARGRRMARVEAPAQAPANPAAGPEEATK